ncbi:unnamed protein product [Rhizoctonia solani]|uniref:Nephrocystin 3-like N-terminal domain-containing protein n=1 Tax=Rhizoctonia solani TaxID=456999 RepID=A0A8H3CLH9_9AGAM|nr:unnamed protein product [Rhizoctonia solani]
MLETAPYFALVFGNDIKDLGSPHQWNWNEGRPSDCALNTQINALRQILSWTSGPSSSSVYWIAGMAGTGKTTIAYTLCTKLWSSGKLAACFFCSRSNTRPREIGLIIQSISIQLAQFSDPFCNALLDVLRGANCQLDKYSLDLLFDCLVSQPLLTVKGTLPDNLVVVIDALDECKDKHGTRQLLEIFLTKGSNLPIKFIVSSRPELHIRIPIKKQGDRTTSRVLLHELDKEIMLKDIENYIRESLQSQPSSLPSSINFFDHEDFPGRDEPPKLIVKGGQVARLAEELGPLFLYAAGVVEYIVDEVPLINNGSDDQPYVEFKDKLPKIYKDISSRKVDKEYTRIIQEALDDPSLNEADRGDIRRVLYVAVRAQEPLRITSISQLLAINTNRVWAALRPLWSVLHISEETGTVTMLHQSFATYILDPTRSKKYCCDPKVYSRPMALRCFKFFRDMCPQFNVCELASSFVPDNKIIGLEERVQAAISPDLFYAAQHWVVHLCSTVVSESLDLFPELEQFLSLRLLFWMEIMNLKGCKYLLPALMHMVKNWIESHAECSADLRALVHDAWKFTQTFAFGEVSDSTPHLYTSMLAFWPESSPISRLYAERTHGMTRVSGTAIDRRQYGLLAISHFNDTTRSPVYSPGGDCMAVAVGNHIILLSPTTCREILPPFKGHVDAILSIQFSPDGTRVVSGSCDRTIRVWNTETGEDMLAPICGHTGNVNSVEISPDGTKIVSGSQDETISVFDLKSGVRLLGPITGHGPVFQVRCSPDGRCIAACTRNGVMTLGIEDGRVLKTFQLGSNNISFRSVDVSPDGTRIASGSTLNTIYVWDVDSGEVVLGPLYLPDTTHDHRPFTPVSFSSDGSQLASSSADGRIYLWDSWTGDLIHSPLDGHTGNITSFSFSPDGTYVISGSSDKTLCLWSMQGLTAGPDLRGHTDAVTSVGFSPGDTYIASNSAEGNICVWDSESRENLFDLPGKGPSGKVQTMYSPRGTSILLNSSEEFLLLDSQKGKVILGPIHLPSIQSATFSSDGTRIILGSAYNVVRVLSASTGRILLEFYPPITNQSNWVHMTSIASSPDGTRIAVGSMHYCFSMHDAVSGKLLNGPFDGYTNGARSLSFSPDGSYIAIGSFRTVQVRDAQSGKILLGPLEGHTDWVNSVEFSPNGDFIVSSGRDSTLFVWDAETGQQIFGPIRGHTGPVRSMSYSHDGTRVVSGSDDRTIRVTNVSKEFQYPTGSLSPTGSEWELRPDGWVVDNRERLLVWVPPELRSGLMRPRTESIISRKGWLRLNFHDALLGESWQDCYRLNYSADLPFLECLETYVDEILMSHKDLVI